MGDVIAFKKPAARKRGLCQHGFHQWVVDTSKRFDVRQGKLITVYRCSRCGKERVKSH